MSQRLIKPGMVIGYGKRGPIFLQAGGAEDNTDPDNPPGGNPDADDTDDAEGGDDDAGDDADADKDKKDDKAKKDDDEDEETVPKWKYDKAHNRMVAADRTSADLKRQLDELKNSKDISADVKKELEELKTKVGTVEAERDKMAEANRSLSIKLAALTMTGDGMPVWEDPDVALRLADLSDVDMSDDGKVDKKALRSALKQLAKEKPYLVKKVTKQTGDAGANESGSQMNGNRKGQGHQPSRQELAKRFPALNRVG